MLNTAILQGRLVADPELRTTQSGISVTSFRIAVDRNYAPKGEERQSDFINIVAWRGTAELICKYFVKGQMILVNGSIQTRQYEDRDGNKRTAVEVVADGVNFCGSKSEQSSSTTHAHTSAANYSKAPSGGDFEEILTDDDLPF